ncbi:hypothetical protein [Streptomyces filamentosus]|uniref:hypothetical protein n=1 Tax=Streptomyces filamentosus TaxID=67294 RepID=UPI00123B8E8A|nr:hypothetical protein [Streptomyces filamentosus]KAA6211775.1 hypothetical protein CP979_36010 [Streptomyces filamentosus]KAA6220059.1 hypothetical protein CP979_26545 [Streptomyces filamentosus]
MAVGNVQITGTGQLIDLSRRLRAAGGPRLRANFARRIRRAAEPMHADLQSAIRNVNITPGRGPRTGGPSPTTRPLRATIAEAIRISVRTGANPGARVWVDKSLLPSDLRNMASVINEGRIRHPVYGNRRKWVTQWASPPWWDTTVNRHTPRMRAEVERVLGDVRRTIT